MPSWRTLICGKAASVAMLKSTILTKSFFAVPLDQEKCSLAWIAVDDPCRAPPADRRARSHADLAHANRRDATFVDDIGDGLPAQKLHDDVRAPVGQHAKVGDVHDVRALGSAGKLRLLAEIAAAHPDPAAWQDLHRHQVVQKGVGVL